jgi:3-isopropylmalate dehydrogenase
LGLETEAIAIEHAVATAIEGGARTADVAGGGAALSTRAMGDAVLARLGA